MLISHSLNHLFLPRKNMRINVIFFSKMYHVSSLLGDFLIHEGKGNEILREMKFRFHRRIIIF